MGRKKRNLTLQKYSAALPSKKLPSGELLNVSVESTKVEKGRKKGFLSRDFQLSLLPHLNLIVRPLEPAPKNVKPSILPSPLLRLSWRGAQQPAIFTLRTRLSGSVNASWSSEEGGKEGNGVSGHLFPKKEDFDSSILSFFSVKGGRGRAGLA